MREGSAEQLARNGRSPGRTLQTSAMLLLSLAIGVVERLPGDGVAAAAVAAPPAETAPPPVRCPAIERDDGRQTQHPGEPLRPIDLVVVATASQGPAAHSYYLRVERALYGRAPAVDLLCRSFRPLPLGEPRIVALVSAWHAGLVPYEAKYSAAVDDLAAHEALAQARADWHAAAAHAIFVGRDVTDSLSPEERARYGGGEPTASAARTNLRDAGRRFHLRYVEVVDILHSPPAPSPPAPGPSPQPPGPPRLAPRQIVPVDLLGVPRNSRARAPSLGEEIYFSAHFAAAEGGVPARWEIVHRQPAAMRDAVRESLARRPLHPLVQVQHEGRAASYREVLFAGSLDQALQLLTSPSPAAVELGRRRLLYEPDKSLALVSARFDQRLLEQRPDARDGEYRQQARLAQLLVDLEPGRTHGEAAKRVARILAAARAGDAPAPLEPPMTAAPPTAPPTTTDAYRVNRSLQWLLQAFAPQDAADAFGAELKTLAAAADEPWSGELRRILAESQIAEYVELREATQRMRGIRPRQTRPALWHDGDYLLAFAPRGDRLLTLGDGVARIWDVRDWSFIAEWTYEGRVEAALFTPAGDQVWIAGELDDDGLLRKLDALTGRPIMDLSADRLPIDELALSADGKTLATASDEEQHLQVWDAVSGKLRRTIDLDGGAARLALRPDGQLLIREMHADSWQWESLADSAASADPRTRQTRLPLRTAVFHPQQPVLFALERTAAEMQAAEMQAAEAAENAVGENAGVDNPGAGELAYVVSVRKSVGDFAWLPQRSEPLVGSALRIAADGSRVAVVSPRETQWTFTVLETPSLRPVSRCQLVRSSRQGPLDSWQLSPDGRVLAVALAGEPPALFDAQTGARFAPGGGHGAPIVDVSFVQSGKLIRTLDVEGGVCEWDAGTLRLAGRVASGEESHPAAPASREGPFTEDGRTFYRLQTDARGRQLTVFASEGSDGQARKIAETRLATVPDGPRGLAPGGKWLYLGAQIFDRQTLQVVSKASLRGRNVTQMTFSSDGRLYAVATQGNRLGDDGELEDEYQASIHDTASGRMLAALPPTSHALSLLAFSPDATRLIVVRDDNELEAWQLPLP